MMQGDLFTAQTRKAEALERVAENAGTWMAAVLSAARDMADDRRGMIVTGEAVRGYLEPIVGPPHHHNAWGAAIAQIVRKGLLVPTGRWVPMTGPKSNARRTPEYRVTC